VISENARIGDRGHFSFGETGGCLSDKAVGCATGNTINFDTALDSQPANIQLSVALHEIGHYFGLPHSPDGKGLKAASENTKTPVVAVDADLVSTVRRNLGL
jgi:Matrixin